MKNETKAIAAVGLLCAASITCFTLTPSETPATASLESSPVPAAPSHSDQPDPPTGMPPWLAPVTGDANGELVSTSSWQAAFAMHLEKCSTREEAMALLIAELDQKYHEWVSSRLATLSQLPPLDRYDALAEMESRLHSVSQAILGHLGLPNARHVGVLAQSLEAISAEIQYAEMPGTHEARVAMLRLDRERETRFERLVAANGHGPDMEALVLGELTPWYESELRQIVGAQDVQ